MQGSVLRGVAILFLFAVLGVTVVLGFQNVEYVTLALLAWTVVAPLWLVVAAGYILGMLSGWAVAGVLKKSWRRATETPRE